MGNFVLQLLQCIVFLHLQYMENISSTPKKLLQKVFQLILVGFGVLFYILKVYQSRTPGNVFFQDGVRRWLPKPLNDHNSVTINSILMILVSISRSLGARNTLGP